MSQVRLLASAVLSGLALSGCATQWGSPRMI